jgi:hypothetical protein
VPWLLQSYARKATLSGILANRTSITVSIFCTQSVRSSYCCFLLDRTFLRVWLFAEVFPDADAFPAWFSALP